MRRPSFRNLEKVLRHEAPDRPTLFEFFLNSSRQLEVFLYERDPF